MYSGRDIMNDVEDVEFEEDQFIAWKAELNKELPYFWKSIIESNQE